jgi:hypothetical protein
MNRGISQADLTLFSELPRAGIPLDDEVVGSLKASGRSLTIYQSNNNF